VFQEQSRSAGFLGKKNADDLWKSAVSVSRAGMRRGRGRKINASLIKDLNKGQVIGCGEIGMEWPGLNVPVFRGTSKTVQRAVPVNPDAMEKILRLRSQKSKKKRRLHPLVRGFTSAKLDGMEISNNTAASKFDTTVRPILPGFKTIVMNTRVTSRMSGPLGRVSKFNMLVAVGNGNGMVGIGRARKTAKYSSVLQARSRAQQKLMYVPRHENRTVLHDFFTQFGRAKIEVRVRPEGYGLKCQRHLKVLCQLIGIKDLYAKFHGNKNIDQNVKAFLLGLINQKSHQTIADEVGLNIVEVDPARHNFPKIIAAPEKSVERKTFEHESMCNFSLYTMNDKIVFRQPKFQLFYTKTIGWQNHLNKEEKRRNQDDVRRRLKIKYGQVQSFLAEKYPEAVAFRRFKRKPEQPAEITN